MSLLVHQILICLFKVFTMFVNTKPNSLLESRRLIIRMNIASQFVCICFIICMLLRYLIAVSKQCNKHCYTTHFLIGVRIVLLFV